MKQHLIIVLVPLLLANSLHMAVVRQNLFPTLQIPLSERLFGRNKTLRAFLVVPLLNGAILSAMAVFFTFLLYYQTFLTGILLGFAYLLFELPNSYLKRRLGIAPGQAATRNQIFFTILDKSDSAIGVVFTYWLFFDIPVQQALLLLLSCIFTHFTFSWVLFRTKLKKSF